MVMSRAALTLARLLLSAWFGAAVLFVVIGVREVTHPGFDSMVRDQLAVLRFPAYYVCGFGCLVVLGRAWGSACAADDEGGRRMLRAA